MRLLKTHSHTSNGLTVEPGTREEKQVKQMQTLQQGNSHQSKTCHVPPVWRGVGRKGSRTCRIPPSWRAGGGRERLHGKPTTETAPQRVDKKALLSLDQVNVPSKHAQNEYDKHLNSSNSSNSTNRNVNGRIRRTRAICMQDFSPPRL